MALHYWCKILKYFPLSSPSCRLPSTTTLLHSYPSISLSSSFQSLQTLLPLSYLPSFLSLLLFASSLFPSQNHLRRMTVTRPSSISPGLNLFWRRTDWRAMSLNSWSCKWLHQITHGLWENINYVYCCSSYFSPVEVALISPPLSLSAQELELEDTQSRLQQDLRCRMAIEGKGWTHKHTSDSQTSCIIVFLHSSTIFHLSPDTKKSASELQEEQEILSEIMRTVEKRDMLVSILEEQRLKERAEDRDLESLVLSKGYEFHWTQADDSWGQEKPEWRLNVEHLRWWRAGWVVKGGKVL